MSEMLNSARFGKPELSITVGTSIARHRIDLCHKGMTDATGILTPPGTCVELVVEQAPLMRNPSSNDKEKPQAQAQVI